MSNEALNIQYTNQSWQQDDESEGPEKWEKNDLWPKKKWHMIDKNRIDIMSMYDGRRRDGKKQLIIPNEIQTRNNQLN